MSSDAASCGALTLEVKPRSDRPYAGEVAFGNTSDEPLRVFRPGNSWGDEALSFELSIHGQTYTVEFAPQSYTRNVPGTVEIAPGGQHLRPYDLTDGSWVVEADLDDPPVPGTTLRAVFSVEDSKEAVEQRAWTGRCVSEPVALGAS